MCVYVCVFVCGPARASIFLRTVAFGKGTFNYSKDGLDLDLALQE